MKKSTGSGPGAFHPRDLQGLGRLTVEAVRGITDLAEALHLAILQLSALRGAPKHERTRGITGLVYRNIRSVTNLVGRGLDPLLDQLASKVDASPSSETREGLLAALNGVLGDYLQERNNPLAIPMQFRQNGLPFNLRALPFAKHPGKKSLLVLVHGLCMNDLQWNRKEHNHGAAIAKSLGFIPIYLHYNTGLHVSENGKTLAALLEKTLLDIQEQSQSDVELSFLAHSMGGLVCRSACHYGLAANMQWTKRLRKMVCLGTPHHGALLEKGGNLVDVVLEANPYSAPFARLGKLRSSGITDLRYGNVVDEDWNTRDRFELSSDHRTPVPLPKAATCYAFAATKHHKSDGSINDLIGDGLVSVNSALGRHTNPHLNLSFPESRCSVGAGMNHWDLLDHSEVYKIIKAWLQLSCGAP